MSTNPVLVGEGHRPLRDVVAAELRRLILDGSLPPGERLVEDRLAQQLGVSRNPIREAMRVLEAEGFLDVAARRGAFVAKLSAQQAEDLFQVRLALEPLGARLAASVADPETALITRAWAILDLVRESGPEQDLDVLSTLHTELHSLIFELTRNDYLIALAIPMVKRGQWLLRQSAPLQSPAAWVEHHGLIAAIAAGDPDLAEAAARHHVLSVRNALRPHLEPAEPLQDLA
ncbi:GntR family transcriptional regulator [Kribbella sp. NPDC000426]|uniref:GntR family transcriptional regulator n=1 Tax=Kribbella sp. NPDC000426 TaxID=3154255 RepID=UPI0033339D38